MFGDFSLKVFVLPLIKKIDEKLNFFFGGGGNF